MDDDFKTIQDAAAALGMSRHTLWRKVKALDIPVYKTGRDGRLRLVRLSEVRAAFAPKIAAPVAVQETGEADGE